jgi:hypothetical protein
MASVEAVRVQYNGAAKAASATLASSTTHGSPRETGEDPER